VTEQGLYIGVVQKRGYRGPKAAATVEPLFRLSADGTTWEPLSDHAEKRRIFPNNGCVSWVPIDPHVTEGSVWRFKVATQQSYDERPDDPWRDRFMVSSWSARQLIEVLDVERLGGEPAGREALCTHGVQIRQSGAATIWVRAEGRLWCQLQLVPKDGDPGLHVVDPSALEKPLHFLHYADPESTLELEIGREVRTFLLPDVKPKGSPALRDWAPDAMIVRRVLGRLRLWDPTFAETLELSVKAIERVAAVLAAPPIPINDLDMERARFERARSYLEKLNEPEELVSAARFVLESGPLASEIEQEKARILQAETSKAREAAKDTIQAENDELARVRNEVLALAEERRRLQTEIETVREEQAAFVDRLDEALESRLKEVVQKPERILADVAILRAVEKALDAPSVPQPSRDGPKPQAALTSIPLPERASVTQCTEVSAFSKLLQGALFSNDASPKIHRAIQASFLGGGVPLLLGARARHAFEAFARVSTRGEVHWVHVDPTCVSQRDLLDAGLAELLKFLGNSTSLHLVVLEGVNHAPMESYFRPFLSSYAAAWDASPVTELHGVNGASNGHVSRIHHLSWPRNVLLGGTLVEGVTSLGIPSCCLEECTVVLTDEIKSGPELDLMSRDHPSLRGKNATAKGTSEVSLDTWSAWREICTRVELEAPIERWNQLAQEHRLTRLGRDRFLSTFAASRLSTGGDEQSICDSLAYAALPLLAPSADASGITTQAAEFDYEDLGRAAEVISRLMRK